MAFVAAARAGWLVCQDKDDSERRLVLPLKNNIAANEGGLAFTLTRREGFEQPVVCWERDPVRITADEAERALVAEVSPSKVEAAAAWLKSRLAAGPGSAPEILSAARIAGHSEASVRRAADELGLSKTKAGFSGGWVWTLPSNDLGEATSDDLPD